MTGIPTDIAMKICDQIQEEHVKKIYMVGQMQCTACLDSSKGNPDKMCFASKKDNRGCIYITKRYDSGKF
jgi:hypothetical protein